MGPDCQDIYDTLKANDDTYEVVKTKMDGYFIPEVNTEYEKYMFRNTWQKGDTLDQFCTRLKKMAVNCNFPNATSDSEVKVR